MKGTFTMTTFDGFDPGEQTFYYSDSYFTASGKESNEHLRTMSAALVFPLKGISDTPAETFAAILSDIGFQDITAYDMDHTSLDTMGVILAHKSVHGKEVVAVALRGDGYDHEMAANLISGTEGDIKAFADAEALVESRVSEYIAGHGITSAKYWVTGYSRSGAVANLFGRELNKTPERFYTSADDIYVSLKLLSVPPTTPSMRISIILSTAAILLPMCIPENGACTVTALRSISALRTIRLC